MSEREMNKFEAYKKLGLDILEMDGNSYASVRQLERLKLIKAEVGALTTGLQYIVLDGQAYVPSKDLDELVSRREMSAKALEACRARDTRVRVAYGVFPHSEVDNNQEVHELFATRTGEFFLRREVFFTATNGELHLQYIGEPMGREQAAHWATRPGVRAAMDLAEIFPESDRDREMAASLFIYRYIGHLIAALDANELGWLLDEMPEFVLYCIAAAACRRIAKRANPNAQKEEIKRQALQFDSAVMMQSVTRVKDPATLEALIDQAKYQLAVLRQSEKAERRGQLKVVREDDPDTPQGA